MRAFNLTFFTGLLGLLGMINFAKGGAIFIQPGARIVQFRATVYVPPAPTVIQATGIQSFWPALEPADNSMILQNVVANEGDVLGQWSFFEYFYDGLAPAGVEPIIHGEKRNVYHGDIIASGFVLMNDFERWVGLTKPNQWFIEWRVKRGAEALRKGEVNFNGNATMDLSVYPNVGDFTQAILATELNRAAKWEMGPLIWSNVDVQINGTNSDWCSVDKFILSNATISGAGPVYPYSSPTGTACFFTGFTLTNS